MADETGPGASMRVRVDPVWGVALSERQLIGFFASVPTHTTLSEDWLAAPVVDYRDGSGAT